jgi:protein-S-isoprenylcysteine O-methyltransferase Ste14
MLSTGPPLVHTLLLVTVVIWLTCEVRQGLKQRPDAKVADRGSRPAIRVAYLIGVVGAFIVKRAVPSWTIGSVAPASWIGLVIVWCGVGLRLWSFQTLGRYFTFTVQTSEDQPVISAGPYRVIRHPSYAGILLALIGLGFVIGNWASLALLTVAISSGIVYRINVEESALSRELGGRYQSYAASRKRLIPFIW